MRWCFFFITTLFIHLAAWSQKTPGIFFSVQGANGKPLAGVTVSLLQYQDSSLVALAISDASGNVLFLQPAGGNYRYKITSTGHQPFFSPLFHYTGGDSLLLAPATLQTSEVVLKDLKVSAGRQLIELQPGKTVVNVDAGITNSGATMLETLEKLPGW